MCWAVGDDEMMIEALRDENKNVSAADAAELAEKSRGKKQIETQYLKWYQTLIEHF